jgi:hypothetical protein
MKYLKDFAEHWQMKLKRSDGYPMYAVIKKYYGLDRVRLEMKYFDSCIVGEAYDFMPIYNIDAYNCGMCTNFANSLDLRYEDRDTDPRFYELIDELTIHLNIKHWEIMRSKGKGITKEQLKILSEPFDILGNTI